jgi:hypothetical protein
MQRLFPTLLILLDLGASGVYAFHGDWRRAIYWFAAAVLTATVTY